VGCGQGGGGRGCVLSQSFCPQCCATLEYRPECPYCTPRISAPALLAAVKRSEEAFEMLTELVFGVGHDTSIAAAVELARRANRAAIAAAEGGG
jgi:hypothetical protein